MRDSGGIENDQASDWYRIPRLTIWNAVSVLIRIEKKLHPSLSSAPFHFSPQWITERKSPLLDRCNLAIYDLTSKKEPLYYEN